MDRKLSLIISLLTLPLMLLATAGARGAEFYKGKRVTLLVSYGPGGGYDVYARVLARTDIGPALRQLLADNENEHCELDGAVAAAELEVGDGERLVDRRVQGDRDDHRARTLSLNATRAPASRTHSSNSGMRTVECGRAGRPPSPKVATPFRIPYSAFRIGIIVSPDSSPAFGSSR